MQFALVRKVMLTIDFYNQFQRHTAKVDGVGRDGIFTAKFLSATSATSQHLPKCIGEFVRGSTLQPGKRDGIGIARLTLFSTAILIHGVTLGKTLTPSPSPFKKGEGSEVDRRVGWRVG